jgi:putative transposase
VRAVSEHLFVRSGLVGTRGTQPLSYDLRLPDTAQADALRLLDASRAVINLALTALWPHLDEVAAVRSGPAWKPVDALLSSPEPHGSRQWRCEAEVVGRILRAQAARKQIFAQVLPILSAGFIRPKTETRPPGKERKAISAAITALQRDMAGDDASFVALQNVIEQCCNSFLQHERFPATFEELQPLPLLRSGVLTYAGDDGGEQGQAYRLALDLEAGVVRFRFRRPEPDGAWGWRSDEAVIPLPERLLARLQRGAALLAPTLREVVAPGGARTAVLDLALAVPPLQPLPAWGDVAHVLGVDWGVHTLITATAVAADEAEGKSQQVGRPFFLDTGGFDGRQARTRRQIDQLQNKVRRFEQERDALPEEHPKRAWSAGRIQALLDAKSRCWRKYNARNRALAHLASNVILLLARIHGCSLVAIESLSTLKSTGRGKGVKGRWRQYRKNTTIRGEIGRLLKYKCLLAGVRLRTVPPQHTSHTCPRCGQPANTYRSPTERRKVVDGGRWLWCGACGYNADRDYAASLNIARLGVTLLTQMQASSTAKRCVVRDALVKPVSYTRMGAGLLLPPPGSHARPQRAGKICYYPGWLKSAYLQSSQPQPTFLRLCG